MRRGKEFERVRPVLREAARMVNNYREFWSDYDQEWCIWCLPPSLHAAFASLTEAVRQANLTMADIDEAPES